MNTFWAQISSSEAAGTMFQWARIQENSDWFLPILVVVLLFAYFLRRYRIDAAELKSWQQIILLVLRVVAVFCLLVYYLHPQWEYLVGNSRVAVLIDSSASMGNHDLLPIQQENQENNESIEENEENKENTHNENENGISVGPTRLGAVLDWIERSELFDQLAEKHEVVLYSFDSTLQPKNYKPDLSNNLNDLKPNGDSTAIGDTLFEILQRERGQPLAGIILLTDGGQNAGREIEIPLETAQRLKIPVYPIGVGRTRQPLNFRVGNPDAPDRAFPGDPFLVKVPIEMVGGEKNVGNTENGENENGENKNGESNINGTTTLSATTPATSFPITLPVELWSEPLTPEGATVAPTKIGEKQIQFSDNGTMETVFEVRIAEPDKLRFTVKILPPSDDHFSADNQQQTDIEIVDRKDRVLLFASTPSRDYQFLCSQIYRDKSMLVDVYLPWARPDISQNADKILERFPSTRTEMSEYNIVVAFDPNWRELSDEQIDVLEFWVARQGGGLILFAGTIHQADTVTGWVTEMGMDKIRALYPVEFLAKQSAFEHRYHGDTQAWALKFSRAGEEADFLKPTDNPVESRTFWNEFSGFYGFFAVKGVKPTATLLAASGSPETLGRAETGALIVEQFYGAGRVLYFGSGELWRLRRADEKAYEQIATKMLRYAGQGRLQRESDRGSLATDKQRYSLGSIAQLRITANDAQLNPITSPTVPVDILSPSGTLRTVEGKLDPNMPGTFQTHLPLTEEGTWSIQFTVPGTEERMTRTVQVRMSDLERELPSRNEQLLLKLATKSGGVYFRSPTDALPPVKESSLYGNIDFFTETKNDAYSGSPITELLKIRSQRAVPDTVAEEKILRRLLLFLCSILIAEWTLRRLMKLL
ncbi:MAG: hypothetical protein LBC02_04855 [Planctomycetaceae bacterium]|nr:hypothetical protein [Planctomycetaceae bacterium]